MDDAREAPAGELVGTDTLRFVRHPACTPERLWRAISDPVELTAWMGSPVTVEPRVGGRIIFHFGEGAGIGGAVFVWDPPRRLA